MATRRTRMRRLTVMVQTIVVGTMIGILANVLTPIVERTLRSVWISGKAATKVTIYIAVLILSTPNHEVPISGASKTSVSIPTEPPSGG